MIPSPILPTMTPLTERHWAMLQELGWEGKFELEALDDFDQTPFLFASGVVSSLRISNYLDEECIDLVEDLFNSGANIHAKDRLGNKPIIKARSGVLIKKLLSWGADPEDVLEGEMTTLMIHVTIMSNKADRQIIFDLLDAGASLEKLTKGGNIFTTPTPEAQLIIDEWLSLKESDKLNNTLPMSGLNKSSPRI